MEQQGRHWPPDLLGHILAPPLPTQKELLKKIRVHSGTMNTCCGDVTYEGIEIMFNEEQWKYRHQVFFLSIPLFIYLLFICYYYYFIIFIFILYINIYNIIMYFIIIIYLFIYLLSIYILIFIYRNEPTEDHITYGTICIYWCKILYTEQFRCYQYLKVPDCLNLPIGHSNYFERKLSVLLYVQEDIQNTDNVF